MTNAQIIITEQVTRNITEDLHTFNKWKELGYRVRKGEHGIETRLWKHTKPKQKEEAPENADEETKKQYNNGFYLAKSYLFRQSQVELIEEA